MKKILLVSVLALSACGSTPQPIQINQQTALWYLQAAGCITAQLAVAAAPVVQATSDGQGNIVLAAVGASAAVACKVSVPAAAVASAPAVSS